MCKCPKCGAQLKITTSTWTAKAQAFSMRGQDAGSLEAVAQLPRPDVTSPLPPSLPKVPTWTKSRTWNRLVQSILSGVGLLACGVFAQSNPYLGTVACVSSVFFIGSILLGAENWNVLFGLLDRNGDGRINKTDLTDLLDEWFPADDQPQTKTGPELRLVRQSGYGSDGNTSILYQPDPQEQVLNIPHMPQADTNPWTVTRLVDFLESAFIADTWARACCREHHGISQGQWGALRAHVRFFEEDEDGKQIIIIWGTTDRPTLDGFIEQVSGGVTQPTGSTNH